MGFADIGYGESVPEGVVGRWVEKVDAGGCRGGQEAINKVEGEGFVQFGTE